jgi:hypothetical protein
MKLWTGVVPLPEAAWLLVSALGILAGGLRRHVA